VLRGRARGGSSGRIAEPVTDDCRATCDRRARRVARVAERVVEGMGAGDGPAHGITTGSAELSSARRQFAEAKGAGATTSTASSVGFPRRFRRRAACDARPHMPALLCLLGAMVGAAYTVSLAWNARLYGSSKGAGRAAFLHVLRTAAVVAALVALALAGGRPFLAALAGFACTHAALVFSMRRLA
jgi:hypothetical protein